MEIEKSELYRKLEKNVLFQKTSTPFKYYQGIQYFKDNILRDGSEAVKCNIHGRDVTVILNYRDGYIQSEDNSPAIEWDGHWEYWNKSMIERVVDKDGDTEEFWENGVPVRIEHNLKERRANGENI